MSEINDRLSPKNEPPTTTAVIKAGSTPVFAAMPAATGVSAAIVPTEVPTASDIKHEAMKIPASSKSPGSIDSVMLTVASIAPVAFAACANAPASTKIHTRSIILLWDAPSEKRFIRLPSGTPRYIAIETAAPARKATVMGIL